MSVSPRLATAVMVAFCVMVGISCSKGSSSTSSTTVPVSGSDLDQIEQATSAAGSARYEGSIVFAGGGSGPLRGQSQADRETGTVTYPQQTPSGPAEVEMMWVSEMIYIRRAVVPDDVATSGWLRHQDELPYVEIPSSPMTQVVLVPYDPFSFLEYLVGSQQTAVPAGNETVDGIERQRFTVDLGQTNSSIVPGLHRVELLTDDQRRLQLARLIGDDTIEYRLSDFGGDVSVTAPPADQIGQPKSTPAGESPTGPYEQVTSGTTQGVAWSLMRAPATNDGSCWRFDTTVALDPVAATQPDGATCIAGFDPAGAVADRTAVVVDAGVGAPFDVLVMVAPTGASVGLSFADRSKTPVTEVAPGVYLWTGPASPLAVVLDVELDGETAACGPGPVSSLEDLEDLPPESRAALTGQPWLCL